MTDPQLTRRRLCALALAAPLAPLAATLAPGAAIAATPPQELVERSRLTIERFLVDPELAELPGFIDRSRAIMIVPQLIKGGFIVGGEGGAGVLLAKGSDGSWSMPAFYTLAAGSVGLQIGAQIAEVVFTIMSDGALDALLKNEFKLGVDASVAVGPIGKGVEASTTTNLDADIYSFAKVMGLFGGGALEGAGMLPRESYNQQYYGAVATPRQILVERKYFNEQANDLRNALGVAK